MPEKENNHLLSKNDFSSSLDKIKRPSLFPLKMEFWLLCLEMLTSYHLICLNQKKMQIHLNPVRKELMSLVLAFLCVLS